ncbi:helix-turn-helix domain-containing protein [Pseudolysinimonas sp.]|uniref:arsenate reductase/protein-tyrosine-phosphatase family protein n=1 Tax=Pseudolysinimonas sp. TaxID=2680009 RepID=UPI00286B7DFF|nr:helix-turn-helix domain-containing protein [Pseudolysinimonas sp.]
MNTDRLDLAERAARHAALSDPARLDVVDRLSLGDLSPTELQQALGVTSNLLAHHLGVLEHAGLIERRRSEGDRRRTYVHLVPGALTGLLPGRTATARRVVFVCSANSARSQLAAALWRLASDVPTASAGTQPADRIAPSALAVAKRHGIPMLATSPLALDQVLADSDFVITVCDNAHEELERRPALHWSIPDPVRAGTERAFEDALADLTRRVGDLAPRLTAA